MNLKITDRTLHGPWLIGIQTPNKIPITTSHIVLIDKNVSKIKLHCFKS